MELSLGVSVLLMIIVIEFMILIYGCYLIVEEYDIFVANWNERVKGET